MGIINRMAIMMASRISKADKQKLMDEVVTRFFADMTTEDKQKIVENTMPRIRDGFSTALIIPQMLSAMMGLGQQNNNLASLMPTMVTREQLTPNVTTPGDCQPWQNCPCREICEEHLKQSQAEDKE